MRELEQLRREIENDDECPLAAISPTVVFGEGDPSSPLALVGEGPGEHEAAEGHPFVGRAGRFLAGLLEAAGLRRDELWITNVLKRRAVRVVSGRLRNRLPRPEELAIHAGYLERELKIVQPRLVLCLGNLSAGVLIHRNFRMTLHRGHWFEGPCGKKLMATFHPAYVNRVDGREHDDLYRTTLRDFKTVAAEYRRILAR